MTVTPAVMSHILTGASNINVNHSNLYSIGGDQHNNTTNVTNVIDSIQGVGELISYIATKDARVVFVFLDIHRRGVLPLNRNH